MNLDPEPIEPTPRDTLLARADVAWHAATTSYSSGHIDGRTLVKLQRQIARAAASPPEKGAKILAAVERTLGPGSTTDRETLLGYQADDFPAIGR